MKRIKRIIYAVVTTIIVLLLAFNIYNFFCIKILKHDLATINGYAILEVVSGSMEPTIHVGDMIIIDTKEEEFKEKDIVTFYDVEGSFVTHRIMSINENEMITKGDNNNTEDKPISMGNIVGKYVTKINGAGKLISSFKSPFVMIMILVIGVLICIFISTDKEGNPIMDEDEKEFTEFLKNKDKEDQSKKQENIKKENKKDGPAKKSQNVKKQTNSKSSSAKKTNEVKKTPSKKATTNKKQTKKKKANKKRK